MKKKELKKLMKKFKITIYENHFDNLHLNEDKSVRISAIPCLIKYVGKTFKIDYNLFNSVLNKDLKTATFIAKHAKTQFDFINATSKVSVILGMKDALKRLGGQMNEK